MESYTDVNAPLAFDEQVRTLATLVPRWALHRDRNVKGVFTTGEFFEWMLNHIFGPANWDLIIIDPPELHQVSDSYAYAQCTVRLEVTFADGHTTHKDAVGVWPLQATKHKEGGDLEGTAPERYETVLKAAVTDGLKAAAERLGTCFRPLSDQELKNHIANTTDNKHNGRPCEELVEELYGSEPAAPAQNEDFGKEFEAFTQTILNEVKFYGSAEQIREALKQCGYTAFKTSEATKMRRALEKHAEEQALRAAAGELEPLPL